MSTALSYDFIIATAETLYMVLASTLFVTLLGLPLGTILLSAIKLNLTLAYTDSYQQS